MRTRDGTAAIVRTFERGSTLAGREAELGVARAAIDEALSGDVSICLFVGAAGAGKTTLWDAALELARESGFRVLSCAPVAHEAALGYASLADLLRDVERDRVARLPAPQRHALLAALQEEEGGRSVPEHAAGAGLRSVLAGLAADGPLCIAADDLHWMDRSSLRALGFALRRIEHVPLLVLGTRRQNATAGHLERDASPGSRVRIVHPSALSVAAMHHVLAGALGTTFPRPTLVRITTLSNGNPLLAIELARSVQSTGGAFQPGERAPLAGPNVRRLLGRRIATLSDGQRRTLLVAALVEGGSVRQALEVHAALGWAFEAPTAGTGLIEVGDETMTFGHPLFAEAVLAAAAPHDAAAVHRAIAAVTTRADVRARHLAEASTGPDEEIAAAIDVAVDGAIAAGATAEALELSELAFSRCAPDSPLRFDRLLRLADLLLQAGDTNRGETLLDEALSSADRPPDRIPLLLRLAGLRAGSRPASDVVPLCQEVIRLAGPDRTIKAEAELLLADVAPIPADGLRHVRRAVRLLEASSRPDLEARALTASALLLSQTGQPVPLAPLDVAAGLEDLTQVRLDESARFARGWLRIMADDLDPAREDFAALLRVAEDTGDEAALPGLLAQLGHLEVRAGNWPRSRVVGVEMLQAADRSGQRFWAGLAHTQLASSQGLLGDRDQARRHLDAAKRIATELNEPFIRAVSLLTDALLALGDERYVDAADLAVASRTALIGRRNDPGMMPWLGVEIEATARIGRLDSARELADDLERRGRRARRRRVLGVAARGRAVIEAAEGHLEAAVAHARKSLTILAPIPVPFDVARSELVLGSIHRRRREKRAADEALARALDIFERLGAVAWVRQAQTERARVGLRPRAPATLTDGELQVARLAAAGHSNREIAQEVFLSEKTVEANLARAYQKLGIRRRAELGARLAGPGSPQPD